jgi:predicted dehydrogenase
VSRTIRLGLIGSGNMGPTWAEAGLRYAPNATVVAVGGGTRAPGLAAQFGFDAEPSVDALLARPDVDAVIVCSPQVTHHENVLKAAAAGKHILVEKPMAVTVAQADDMIAAADTAGVTLAVVSQHRFRRTPVAAKRLIEAGAIGTVRMVQVRGITPPWDLPKGNQPWADLGFHLCDILRWLVGSEVTLVSAQFGEFGSIPPQQTAFVIYRFASNALAHVWFSYEITKPGLGSIMQFLVTGSKAMIDLDSYGQCRLSRDDGWDVIEEQPDPNPIDAMSPFRMESYGAQVADFVDAVLTGRDPMISGRDGRRTMVMLEAALASDATRTMIELG